MNEENKNVLDQTAAKIGEEFNVTIEDGVMKITPPEAGIAIFSYISLSDSEQDKYNLMLLEMNDKLDYANDRIAMLYDTLEKTLEMLSEDENHEELCVALLQVLYPVIGITSDGVEIDFSYDRSEDDSGTK